MLSKVPGARWLAQRVFRLQRGMTLGVRVIIRDEQARVLLVHHGYTPGWHLPGGGVDPGESLLQAAKREAREETGVMLTEPPRLLGVYTNFAVFPGDHIAVFVAGGHVRGPIPPKSFEIREQGYFSRDHLPEATSAGTRRRLAEAFDGATISETW